MSECLKEIIAAMERLAPENTAQAWDNVGLLVGERERRDIKTILVALDVTDAVITEAIGLNADLIIAHHPLIFKPVKCITDDTALGRRIINLIYNNIAVYAAHTNLDLADGGTNDILFELLGLTEKGRLELGLSGRLSEGVTLSALTRYVKERLGVSQIKYSGDPDAVITRVGICGGSGSGLDYFAEAVSAGCEAYITGDIKFHDAQAALDMGLCLIDVSHYDSEVFVVKRLAEYLGGVFPNIKVTVSGVDGQVFAPI